MHRIVLINMPFANANRPSLSLTQLQGIMQLKEGVRCEVLYLNQEFAHYFTPELFQTISSQYITGLGDWLFRQIAFPELEDNADTYLERHFPMPDQATKAFKQKLLAKREGLANFLAEMIEKYKLSEAELVGYSSMFSQNGACFAMSQELKQRSGNPVTVMGGANCETPMGQEIARNVPHIDFVFSGPGLINFPRLVDALMKGDRDACHRIEGIFSAQNVDQLSGSALVGQELPLDEVIVPDYRDFIDTYDHHFPEEKDDKLLLFETSRGCWWGERSHCTFCGLNSQSMGYRSMSADVARQQIEHLFGYAEECSHFSCVDNILPKNYVEDVFKQLSPPPNIDIFYEVKADLKAEDLALLSEKKVKRVQPGIEALNTGTLKLMKKGSSAFGNITFLKNCALNDVAPEWNLLVGFPGETQETYSKYVADIPRLVHLPPPGGAFPVRFDRYSPYFTKAEEYGLKLKPYDFYKFIYPFSETSLGNIAYYFQDQNYRAEYTRHMVKWIGKLKTAVQDWHNRWFNALTPPRLYFSGPDRIFDSRFGSTQTHMIGQKGRRVLELMAKPLAPASLARLLADIPNFDADREIARLESKKLIFHEGTRYLSLVFDHKGSSLDHWRRVAG